MKLGKSVLQSSTRRKLPPIHDGFGSKKRYKKGTKVEIIQYSLVGKTYVPKLIEGTIVEKSPSDLYYKVRIGHEIRLVHTETMRPARRQQLLTGWV